MKQLILTFVMVFLVGGAVHAEENAPYGQIDAFEVKEMMDAGEAIVIDSRGGKYFDGIMIAGAKKLSAKDTNEHSLAEIAPDKSVPLVFYCTNTDCPASSIAAYKADKAGYESLYKFTGGIEEWIGQGFPTEVASAH